MMIINLNLIYRCSLALIWSAQATLILGQSLLAINPAVKWDLWAYLFFIAASVMLRLCIDHFVITPSKDRPTVAGWVYLGLEALVLFVLAAAAFKATIYDNSPMLARRAFVLVGILALLIKVFRCELPGAFQWLENNKIPTWVNINVLFMFVIGLIVIVPDSERVLAMMFIGEQWHHMDFFIMSPGLAVLYGKLPYVDVISQYGVGLPIIITRLTGFFGGFDYLNVLNMIMFFVFIYWLLFFVFVRTWLHSPWMALVGFLIAFRLQMMHTGISPMAWVYPSSTPMRFGLDVVWMLCLLLHLRRQQNRYLYAAALYAGFAVFYMTSSGMCVLATTYFYLFLLAAMPHMRYRYNLNLSRLLMVAVLPVLILLMLLVLTLHGQVISKNFWKNMIEYMVFFAHGHAGGVLPMHESLKYRHYWIAFMAVLIPIVYLATLFFCTMSIWYKKIKDEHLIVVLLCVYGLANYQYFVVRSALTSYYLSGIVFALVCCWWFDTLRRRLPSIWQPRLMMAAVVLSAYALMTNHNFISYPNLFNYSANPIVDITVSQRYPDRQGYFNHMVKFMKPEDKVAFNSLGNQDEDIRTEDDFKTDKQLKEYVLAESDFNEDAQLIADLTNPDEAVALLSSFETKILLQAKRKPFFYHLPMLTSQPMRMRSFPADAAHSPHFKDDTLTQLKSQKPRYVFLQKVFMNNQVPASYAQSHASVIDIINFIRENYAPERQGKYLIAMKIKE